MSTKPHRLFAHGEFRQLALNLWIVRGGLSLRTIERGLWRLGIMVVVYFVIRKWGRIDPWM